jgi:hypothetical protein
METLQQRITTWTSEFYYDRGQAVGYALLMAAAMNGLKHQALADFWFANRPDPRMVGQDRIEHSEDGVLRRGYEWAYQF